MKRLLLLALLFCIAGASAVLANQPATMQHPICPAKCTNGMAQVQQFQGNQCVTAYAVPCFPNSCDAQGGTCKVSQCVADSQCAPGAACNIASGLCAPIAYFCDSPFTVQESNGLRMSCSPYKCIAGGCQSVCTVSADCASGYNCNAGRCTK